MGIRGFFDQIEPNFDKGGKWERYYPVYEAVESILYTPKTVTTVAPHARSHIDMKRIMTYVVIATIPAILVGLYNVGYQTNTAIATFGATGWRAWIIDALGIGFDPTNPIANVLHGSLYFLPIYATTLLFGGLCEVAFAVVRKHEINEGFLVSSMLYALIMPPNVPLWQVA
ncbi:MAG: RnfABCDGE type electron transport complex subunit D, partial [Pseudomonadota bacterium]